eukprot:1160151-Pelagomonas_calceolata.AAC.8
MAGNPEYHPFTVIRGMRYAGRLWMCFEGELRRRGRGIPAGTLFIAQRQKRQNNAGNEHTMLHAEAQGAMIKQHLYRSRGLLSAKPTTLHGSHLHVKKVEEEIVVVVMPNAIGHPAQEVREMQVRQGIQIKVFDAKH